MKTRFDQLERRVRQLERRLQAAEEAGVPGINLSEKLSEYPGGIPQLIEDLELKKDVVYRFARGEHRRYPAGLARMILGMFQVVGVRCDDQALRRAWWEARRSQLEEA